MRIVLAGFLLILGSGCQNFMSLRSQCCPGLLCPPEKCEAPPPQPAVRESLPPCQPTAECPPPVVEVKPAKEIHVQAPPARVVVNTPAPGNPAVQAAAVPQAMPVAAAASVPQAVGIPQAAATQMQMMVQSAAPPAPVNMMASTVQTTSRARDRIALGLDWIRIPMPIPRLFAIPGPQQVTTETEFTALAQPQLQAVAAPAIAAQQVPVAVQQVPVAVQPAAAAAVPGQFVVVNTPPAPAAAATQPAQMFVPVQASPAVAAQAVAAAPCPAPRNQVSQATVEELTKQLQAVQQLLDQQQQARERGATAPPAPPPEK